MQRSLILPACGHWVDPKEIQLLMLSSKDIATLRLYRPDVFGKMKGAAMFTSYGTLRTFCSDWKECLSLLFSNIVSLHHTYSQYDENGKEDVDFRLLCINHNKIQSIVPHAVNKVLLPSPDQCTRKPKQAQRFDF
jgi:hypothetical protein